MEYTRQKRRRRHSAKRYGQSSGQFGRAVLALLMIGAIVYLVSASTAGTWIAKNVVVPVFSMVENFKEERAQSKETAQAGGDDEALQASAAGSKNTESIQEVRLDETKKAVDAEVRLPAITCYALQMGVFSSPANAQAQALMLQGSGAGGYIMEEDGRYRVLSAAYSDQAAAASVKERYLSQGVDCAIYTFSTGEATYRVSALEEQLAAVKAGFSCVANAQQALLGLSAAVDAGTLSAADGQTQLRSIAQTLREDMALLSSYEGGHAALSGLLVCHSECLQAIENAANAGTQSAAAFAAGLKYAQLFVTDRYATLMEKLG